MPGPFALENNDERTRSPDDDAHLDYEQGIPHFKGYPGRLIRTEPPAGMSRITLEG